MQDKSMKNKQSQNLTRIQDILLMHFCVGENTDRNTLGIRAKALFIRAMY